MHPYAVDSGERRLIPFLIAAASVLAAWLFYQILGTLAIVIPWWFDAPAVMGFYGMFYTVFDRWLWRTPFMHKIRMVNIPDLNGKWTGFLASSYDEHRTRHSINVTVYQTWSRIQIVLQTERSNSHSLMASIRTENPAGPELSYEYLNEPHADAKGTMHIHRGTNRLTLYSDKGKTMLDGEYYTGRDRLNYGTLHLERLK
jgi:hypothetical protein